MGLAALVLFTGCAASMNGTLETPVLTPAGGTFSTSQTVTVSDTTPGVVLHCTLDGSAPSKSSPICTQPITVYKSGMLSAVAVAADGTTSSPVSATYTINFSAAATPVISPAGGTFSAAQTVTLTDTTSGASIYYTTDGTAPTTASLAYTGPFTVSASGTVNAVAISAGTTLSAVATASFTIDAGAAPAATPVFSPAGGSFTTSQTVTLTDATPNAVIYYTIDGSTPTAATAQQYAGAITVSTSETINAIAVVDGSPLSAVATATFTINGGTTPPPVQTPTPTITPPGGSFTAAVQNVTITDTVPNAAIYYTTDGSTPTFTSTLYTAPFTVSTTETVKAIASAIGSQPSNVSTAVFTLSLGQTSPPAFSVPSTTGLTSQIQVILSDSTPGATIYYTLNGTPATTSSTPFTTNTIPVAATETINAIAIAPGFSLSAQNSATYTFDQPDAATPTISVQGGSYTSAQTVILSDATPGASIYYTTDGSVPSSLLTPHASPYTVSVSTSETLNVIAGAPGYNFSPVATAAYTITLAAAQPTFSPQPGTYTSAQTVTLSDATTGSSIYYTLDGTTPTPASTLYSAAIPVSTTETIKAVATAPGYITSTVSTGIFTIQTIVGSSLSGEVSTGTTPVVGASVQLYAAGTTGYGSAPTALLTTPVVTDQDGSFAIGYTCAATPGDQVYLVATGGSVGGTANSSIALMTALGTCSTLPANASYTVNDITTIASAYALSAFALPASGGGITVGAPVANADPACVSTAPNTCNYKGLANSFKTVQNLVNITTGDALTITPFYATGTKPFLNTSAVPQARINTLGDILATCTQQAAAGGCSALFTAATPSTGTPPVAGTAPVDTLQAALNIAQNPGSNVDALYALLPATEVYAPTLADQGIAVGICDGTDVPCVGPNDFVLAITYTGGGLGLPVDFIHGSMLNTSMDIDPTGNILVTAYLNKGGATQPSSSTGIIAGFNGLGEAFTPAAVSYTALGGVSLAAPPTTLPGPLSVAVDQAGKIWVDNFGSVEQLNPDLTYASVKATLPNSLDNKNNVTIDGSGNVWATGSRTKGLQVTASVLLEVSDTGTFLSPSTGYTGVSSVDADGFDTISQVTFDSDGGLWATDDQGVFVDQIDHTNGQILQHITPPGAGPNNANGSTPTVADGAGNIYACPSPTSAILNVFNATSLPTVPSFTLANGRACGSYSMAIDGQSHIFANNYSSTAGAQVLDEFTTQGVSISPSDPGYAAASRAETTVLSNRVATAPIKIDGSGNVWALNSQTTNVNGPGNVLVEFVGVAAPVVTPVSLALTNSSLAARP